MTTTHFLSVIGGTMTTTDILSLIKAIRILERTPTQKVVLFTLAIQCDNGRRCWPSMDHLTREVGLSSPASTRRVLKQLEDLGDIRRTWRPSQTNLFELFPNGPEGRR